jgi:hypothetical protein
MGTDLGVDQSAPQIIGECLEPVMNLKFKALKINDLYKLFVILT